MTTLSPTTAALVSDFCQWADSYHGSASVRRKLPPALRRAVEVELPSRDSRQLAVFRPINEDSWVRVDHRSVTTVVFTTRVTQGFDTTLELVAGVLGPAWQRGWKRVSRNEHVSSIVDDYFHAMTTYVFRSRFLKITAALGLAYEVDCTFQFGSWSREMLVGAEPYLQPTFGASAERVARDVAVVPVRRWRESSRQRYCHTLIDSLNTLDPHIHRILYLYLRALRLRNGEFWEDAVISLDSAVDVAEQLVRERTTPAGAHSGQAMISALQLSDHTDAVLGHLRTLRNYFGAHPSQAGFWDFGEDYADIVESMFAAVRDVVWAASRFEARHRVVEPDADHGWAAWFHAHAGILSPTVWFRLDPPPAMPLSSAPSKNTPSG